MFDNSLYRQFSARGPLEGTAEYAELHHHIGHLHPGLGRSASMQGGYQIATLFITLAIAISGGLVTGVFIYILYVVSLLFVLIMKFSNSGLILRLPIFGKVPRDHLFDDELSWEVPEEDHHHQGISQVSHHDTSASPMVHHGKAVGDTHI